MAHIPIKCIGSNTPFPLLSSDHNIVHFQVHGHKTKMSQSPSSTSPRFVFPKGDYSSLNNFIATSDFSTFMTQMTLNLFGFS